MVNCIVGELDHYFKIQLYIMAAAISSGEAFGVDLATVAAAYRSSCFPASGIVVPSQQLRKQQFGCQQLIKHHDLLYRQRSKHDVTKVSKRPGRWHGDRENKENVLTATYSHSHYDGNDVQDQRTNGVQHRFRCSRTAKSQTHPHSSSSSSQYVLRNSPLARCQVEHSNDNTRLVKTYESTLPRHFKKQRLLQESDCVNSLQMEETNTGRLRDNNFNKLNNNDYGLLNTKCPSVEDNRLVTITSNCEVEADEADSRPTAARGTTAENILASCRGRLVRQHALRLPRQQPLNQLLPSNLQQQSLKPTLQPLQEFTKYWQQQPQQKNISNVELSRSGSESNHDPVCLQTDDSHPIGTAAILDPPTAFLDDDTMTREAFKTPSVAVQVSQTALVSSLTTSMSTTTTTTGSANKLGLGLRLLHESDDKEVRRYLHRPRQCRRHVRNTDDANSSNGNFVSDTIMYGRDDMTLSTVSSWGWEILSVEISPLSTGCDSKGRGAGREKKRNDDTVPSCEAVGMVPDRFCLDVRREPRCKGDDRMQSSNVDTGVASATCPASVVEYNFRPYGPSNDKQDKLHALDASKCRRSSYSSIHSPDVSCISSLDTHSGRLCEISEIRDAGGESGADRTFHEQASSGNFSGALHSTFCYPLHSTLNYSSRTGRVPTFGDSAEVDEDELLENTHSRETKMIHPYKYTSLVKCCISETSETVKSPCSQSNGVRAMMLSRCSTSLNNNSSQNVIRSTRISNYVIRMNDVVDNVDANDVSADGTRRTQSIRESIVPSVDSSVLSPVSKQSNANVDIHIRDDVTGIPHHGVLDIDCRRRMRRQTAHTDLERTAMRNMTISASDRTSSSEGLEQQYVRQSGGRRRSCCFNHREPNDWASSRHWIKSENVPTAGQSYEAIPEEALNERLDRTKEVETIFENTDSRPVSNRERSCCSSCASIDVDDIPRSRDSLVGAKHNPYSCRSLGFRTPHGNQPWYDRTNGREGDYRLTPSRRVKWRIVKRLRKQPCERNTSEHQQIIYHRHHRRRLRHLYNSSRASEKLRPFLRTLAIL